MPAPAPPPILSAKGGQACTSISRGFLKIEWAAGRGQTAPFFPFEPLGFRAEPFALARRSLVRRGRFRVLLSLREQGWAFLRAQALPVRALVALVRVLVLALVLRQPCPYFTPAERLT